MSFKRPRQQVNQVWESSREDRWAEITATSPSGKTLFVCRSCGRTSPTPDRNCADYARVNTGQFNYKIPCALWPMSAHEYEGFLKTRDGWPCTIVGTVIMADGTRIPVACGIPTETAEQLLVTHTELAILGKVGTVPK
jgi:hypothetical protein